MLFDAETSLLSQNEDNAIQFYGIKFILSSIQNDHRHVECEVRSLQVPVVRAKIRVAHILT